MGKLWKMHSCLEYTGECRKQGAWLPKEQAKFHEIGALDALADIAGSFAGMQSLGLERVLSRPIHVGSGFVKSHMAIFSSLSATLESCDPMKFPGKQVPLIKSFLRPQEPRFLHYGQEFLQDFPLLVAKEVVMVRRKGASIAQCSEGLIAELIPAQDQVKKRNHEQHGIR